MNNLVFCGACLATDIKMYNLWSTSPDNTALRDIYLDLASPTKDTGQFLCFECAANLRRCLKFKQTCFRAQQALSSINVKNFMKHFDRNEYNLVSNLQITNTICITIPICDEDNNFDIEDYHDMQLKNKDFICNTDYETHRDIKVKVEKNTLILNGADDADIEKAICIISDENNDDINVKEELMMSAVVLNKLEEEIENNFTLELETDEEDIKSNQKIKRNKINNDKGTCTNNETNKVKKQTKKASKKLTNSNNVANHSPKSESVQVYKRYSHSTFKLDDYGIVERLTPEAAEKELLQKQSLDSYKKSPFKCESCFKGFKHEAPHKNHMIRHDKVSGDHECQLCLIRFPTKNNLGRHFLDHLRKFSCKSCTFVCFGLSLAKQHVAYHSGEQYSCEKCGKTFRSKHNLVTHRARHRAEAVCELCGHAFASGGGLKQHKKLKHTTDTNPKEGPHCDVCDVHFASEKAWKLHLVKSTKHQYKYKEMRAHATCGHCGERFPSPAERRAHAITKHQHHLSRRYPKTCEQCGEQVSSRTEAAAHARTHPQSARASVMCELCGRECQSTAQLKIHMRMHTGERPYQCARCDKSYTSRVALESHQNWHDDVRPHACQFCGKTFRAATTLGVHLKRHLEIMPYKCSVCNKAFVNPSALRVHVRHSHEKVPWPKRTRPRRKKQAKEND